MEELVFEEDGEALLPEIYWKLRSKEKENKTLFNANDFENVN